MKFHLPNKLIRFSMLSCVPFVLLACEKKQASASETKVIKQETAESLPTQARLRLYRAGGRAPEMLEFGSIYTVKVSGSG